MLGNGSKLLFLSFVPSCIVTHSSQALIEYCFRTVRVDVGWITEVQ